MRALKLAEVGKPKSNCRTQGGSGCTQSEFVIGGAIRRLSREKGTHPPDKEGLFMNNEWP